MKDLLGGKGANLAEMTNIGLPVPQGFTISTEACVDYSDIKAFPEGLEAQYLQALANLEAEYNKKLGDWELSL